MLKTSLKYYYLKILNPHFSWQPNRQCWLQSKLQIQFIFYFIILLIKLSYSIHPFHVSFYIHQFHASFHIHPFHASLNVADVPDEFTELRNESTARDLLQEKKLMNFGVPCIILILMLSCFRYGCLCHLLLPIFVKVVFQFFCKLKQRQEIDWMFNMT